MPWGEARRRTKTKRWRRRRRREAAMGFCCGEGVEEDATYDEALPLLLRPPPPPRRRRRRPQPRRRRPPSSAATHTVPDREPLFVHSLQRLPSREGPRYMSRKRAAVPVAIEKNERPTSCVSSAQCLSLLRFLCLRKRAAAPRQVGDKRG